MNLLFTCRPDAHPALYDWVRYLERLGEIKTLETRQGHKRSQELDRHRYRNQMPIRETQPA